MRVSTECEYWVHTHIISINVVLHFFLSLTSTHDLWWWVMGASPEMADKASKCKRDTPHSASLIWQGKIVRSVHGKITKVWIAEPVFKPCFFKPLIVYQWHHEKVSLPQMEAASIREQNRTSTHKPTTLCAGPCLWRGQFGLHRLPAASLKQSLSFFSYLVPSDC